MNFYFKRILLFIANFLNCNIFPPTKFFQLKSFSYRIAGISLGSKVCFVGGAKILFHNISFGSNVWIGSYSYFYSSIQGRIELGSNIDIAPNTTFITGTHEIGDSNRRAGKNIGLPITVGNGCWIGVGSIILGGTKIGEGCIVAAGAVVRGDFPNNVVIGGIPARIIKHLPS